MSSSSHLCLDHIIILVPHSVLLNPPASLTSNFTLTPGGRHADDKTENKLIIFRDGSYIELIAFINDGPQHRKNHWWGDKSYGVIDFALTSTSSISTSSSTTSPAKETHESVQHRLLHQLPSGLTNIEYSPPIAGGRKLQQQRQQSQDDDDDNNNNGNNIIDIKWQVTFPKNVKRGQIPFFCHDVTPRYLRVPNDPKTTQHPCGAYGVKSLTVYVPTEDLQEFGRVYAAIFGVQSINNTGGGGGLSESDDLANLDNNEMIFKVGRVQDPKGAPPQQQQPPTQIHLRPAVSGVHHLPKRLELGDIVLSGGGDGDGGGGGKTTTAGDTKNRRVIISDAQTWGDIVVEYD